MRGRVYLKIDDSIIYCQTTPSSRNPYQWNKNIFIVPMRINPQLTIYKTYLYINA